MDDLACERPEVVDGRRHMTCTLQSALRYDIGVRRRLFNLAAAMSLVLSVAMIVLWFANAPPVRYPALPLQGAVSSVRWFAGTGRGMVFVGLVTWDPNGPVIAWDGLGFMYMSRPEQGDSMMQTHRPSSHLRGSITAHETI